MRKLLIYIICFFSLSSCDYFIHYEGFVIDRDTNKAIENVKVQLIIKDTINLGPSIDGFLKFENEPLLTDSSGYFSAARNIGRPHPHSLLFVNPEYRTYVIDEESLNRDSINIIYLNRK